LVINQEGAEEAPEEEGVVEAVKKVSKVKDHLKARQLLVARK
jgi:hypothetical protein